jgi:nitroreductase
MKAYDPTLTPWQLNEAEFPEWGTSAEKLTFLLHYAILAASNYNTQPWKFAVDGEHIHLFVDPARWLKVADADQRELYLSAGCALENLLVAASHFDYAPQVTYFPKPDNADWVATIRLTTPIDRPVRRNGNLFRAIQKRHTDPKPYDPRPLHPADLQRLRAYSLEKDLQVYFSSDAALKHKIEALIARGNALQFANPAYRAELADWIGRGAFRTSRLITYLGRMALSYINVEKTEPGPEVEVLPSAPMLGLISSSGNSREVQVKSGQVFERISLTATALGIGVQPLSQIIQIPELRGELAKLTPTPEFYPQHAFRLGYTKFEPAHSPRRPLAELLVNHEL